MDFEQWKKDLFDETYPRTRLDGGIFVKHAGGPHLDIQWGKYSEIINMHDLYNESSVDNPVTAILEWIYGRFPIQRDLEKKKSFLSHNPMTGTYNAYILRSPKFIYAMYCVEPKKWMSRKSAADFSDVVEHSISGSLIEVKPLTPIPAATLMSYPYVMQSVIEEHLDYNKDYQVAAPIDDKGCLYIGSERPISRLTMDSEGAEYTTMSLKKVLKEHYEHIR